MDPIREHWTRPSAEPWEDLTAEPVGVTYREVAGRNALWLDPAGASDDGLLFYIHGGGFVAGGVGTHRKLVGHLANALGTRALLAGYDHAPAAVYPAQVDQVVDAYEWAARDAGRVVVAGDSCGAWLALSLTRRVSIVPSALLLISPWVDLTQSGQSYETNAAADPFFHKPVVDALAAGFLGPTDPADPEVDLLQADLTGFPPMAIQVGGDETLLDDSRALHAIAERAGVTSRLEVFPGQLHTFQMAAGKTAVADAALRSLADWAVDRRPEAA